MQPVATSNFVEPVNGFSIAFGASSAFMVLLSVLLPWHKISLLMQDLHLLILGQSCSKTHPEKRV